MAPSIQQSTDQLLVCWRRVASCNGKVQGIKAVRRTRLCKYTRCQLHTCAGGLEPALLPCYSAVAHTWLTSAPAPLSLSPALRSTLSLSVCVVTA